MCDTAVKAALIYSSRLINQTLLQHLHLVTSWLASAGGWARLTLQKRLRAHTTPRPVKSVGLQRAATSLFQV
jgi:hypothetical protein